MRIYDLKDAREKIERILLKSVEVRICERGGRYLIGNEEKIEIKSVNIIDYGKKLLRVDFDDNGDIKSCHCYNDIFDLSLKNQVEYLSLLLNRNFELNKRGMNKYLQALECWEKFGEII